MATQVLTAQGPFVLTLLGTINSAGEVVADLTTVAAGSLAIANDLSDLADADTALGNLGGTADGIAMFKAADVPAQLALLGGDTAGIAVFESATAADAQTAIGATATGSALIEAADASAVRTAAEMTLFALDYTCSVAAGTAGALYLKVPTGITGTVTKVWAVTNGDPGADVAFVTAIGPSGGAYVAITNGDFTVANTTAAGVEDSATPTAANAVTGGTSIVRVSWADTAAVACVVGVVVEITRS